MDDLSLVRKAAAQGLDLWPISNFCIEPLARKGLLLGYGGYSVSVIKDAARRLTTAMHSA